MLKKIYIFRRVHVIITFVRSDTLTFVDDLSSYITSSRNDNYVDPSKNVGRPLSKTKSGIERQTKRGAAKRGTRLMHQCQNVDVGPTS